MDKVARITVREVEYTAFSLAKELMLYDEPIPDFGTRFPSILESCIESPHATYNKEDLYPGLIGKASILFYLMIKNHPFQNGNKRIAVMSLLYFLYKNDKWLQISNDELYNFAKKVAESKHQERPAIIIGIQEILTKYLIDWVSE